ncbi:MAG: regulatory iron-sulfur-containing complex subunit RicT [Candidatus Falkowbacteria bacterium]|nr:regulatory iron-sulfur-containing complex subunit RicT [Candidatus Falkowbacteria bacterium]
MSSVQIQFASWDKIYNFSNQNNLELKVGEAVMVETELGLELGRIIGFKDDKNQDRELKPILRIATYDDVANLPNETKKLDALNYCKQVANRLNLEMKLVDAHFSYSGNRITFAFIADGRIDFRDLVKDLTAYFNCNIRLNQIGIRDEARASGDCGPCGNGLCCRSFLKDFFSITSEMAEAQQVVHRGSERISGMCGRLMCCLSYEYEGYKDMAGELPPLGVKVNVDGKRGVVVGHHILKQSVDVEFPPEKAGDRNIFVEVDLNRHKKSKK